MMVLIQTENCYVFWLSVYIVVCLLTRYLLGGVFRTRVSENSQPWKQIQTKILDFWLTFNAYVLRSFLRLSFNHQVHYSERQPHWCHDHFEFVGRHLSMRSSGSLSFRCKIFLKIPILQIIRIVTKLAIFATFTNLLLLTLFLATIRGKISLLS